MPKSAEPEEPDEPEGDDTARPPRVVALGGGHGLYASLSALRRVTTDVTAIVTVADDGGSSGRLREELGVLPPGDLRMALSALCGDDEWGHTWTQVLQHRFRSEGDLHGHAVGNLLIVALWELLGDSVAGLDWVGQLLGAHGRVLPMSSVPLEISAEVLGVDPERPDDITTVRGQVACASTNGRVRSVSLLPEEPPASTQAVKAVREADWVVFGPGSWFTSVLPHLLVPDLAHALITTRAKRMVALNLSPQKGETDGFRPETYLEVLREHAPKLGVDVVLADTGTVEDPAPLASVVAELGGRLELADLSLGDGTPRHDTDKLAAAFERVLTAPEELDENKP